MHFQKFKENYLKSHEVQEYPSPNFIRNYIDARMKEVVGTETQLKNKRDKLNEKGRKLYADIVAKANAQSIDIAQGYINLIISEYNNKELAEKIFNKLLVELYDYDDRLDRARDILYNFSDIIETYKPV